MAREAFRRDYKIISCKDRVELGTMLNALEEKKLILDQVVSGYSRTYTIIAYKLVRRRGRR